MQRAWIFDGGGHLIVMTVGNPVHRLAEDFAGACLRQR
jgi:hypothetical protein